MERRNDRVGTPNIQAETDGETGSVPPLGPACESGDWRSLYEQAWGQKEAWRARAGAAEGRYEELTRSETQARTRVGQLQCLLEKKPTTDPGSGSGTESGSPYPGEALKSAVEVK